MLQSSTIRGPASGGMRTPSRAAHAGAVRVALLGVFFLSFSLKSQSVVHLSITQPGGMPGLPVMTGITHGTNGVTLTWDGPSGYYQLYQKSNSVGAAWVALGKPTNLVRNAVVSKLYNNGFFRVSGPSPLYAGSPTCADCHQNVTRPKRIRRTRWRLGRSRPLGSTPTRIAWPATRWVMGCRPDLIIRMECS